MQQPPSLHHARSAGDLSFVRSLCMHIHMHALHTVFRALLICCCFVGCNFHRVFISKSLLIVVSSLRNMILYFAFAITVTVLFLGEVGYARQLSVLISLAEYLGSKQSRIFFEFVTSRVQERACKKLYKNAISINKYRP